MKRLFDLAVSVPAVLALAPLGALVAALIKADSDGPVFYRGARAARHGRPFRIFKFRTMVNDADAHGPSSTSDNDSRVTRVGALLRRYKLDELPQLLNVVAGDMSLVGPRPQVPWAVALYDEVEKQILSVRPGITDFASIRFRNEGEILRGSADPDREYLKKIAPEKNRLSLEYVRRRSFGLDLRLIAATLWALGGGDPDRIVRIPAGRVSPGGVDT